MKKLLSILISLTLLLSCQKETIEKETPKQDTIVVIQKTTPTKVIVDTVKQIAYYNLTATFDNVNYERFILSDTGKYTIKSGWRVKKWLFVTDGSRKASKELEPLGSSIVYYEKGNLKLK
jgi:hypothetical protein